MCAAVLSVGVSAGAQLLQQSVCSITAYKITHCPCPPEVSRFYYLIFFRLN